MHSWCNAACMVVVNANNILTPTLNLDMFELLSPTTHAITQLLKRLEDFGDDEAQDIVGAFETKYSKIKDRYKVSGLPVTPLTFLQNVKRTQLNQSETFQAGHLQHQRP